jgi:hypothetical protein
VTLSEYKEALSEMSKRHEKELNKLSFDYVQSLPNKLNIGDKLDYNGKKLIVDAVKWGMTIWGAPDRIYICKALTKQGTPRKNGDLIWVYQGGMDK